MAERGGHSKPRDVLEELLAQSGAPVKLFETDRAVCPACGKPDMWVEEYVYKVPIFDYIILTVGRCRSCGYTFRDVKLAEQTEPKKIVVSVEGENQLRYLVARSPQSAVVIPEVGLEMVPARASVGFITTVEGLLWRFHEVAVPACKHVQGDEERYRKCMEAVKWIERAIEGKEKFTLIICDYDGKSRIVGENVGVEELDEDCRRRCPQCPGQLGRPTQS